MGARRSFVGTGVAALLVAGVLPALTATAGAVVVSDKIVLLGGASTAKFPDVYVANANGSGQKLVHKGTSAQAPDVVSIAPTNNRIAVLFANAAKDESPNSLAVMNVDGSGFKVLVKGTTKADFDLVNWNQAGTKLLVSVQDQNSGSGYLAIVNTTVAHPKLVRLKGSTGLLSGAFSTVSDSTVIAGDGHGNLVTLKGGLTTTVLAGSQTSLYSEPSFAPGDKAIVFGNVSLSGKSIVSKIDTATPDGDNLKTLAGSGFNLYPHWSSDGLTVYYDSINIKTDALTPYRVAASGGTPTKLTLASGKIYEVFGAAAPDTTAPAAASTATVTLNGAKPVVSWKAPADLDVSHYVVRRAAGAVAPSTPADGTAAYTGATASFVDTVTPGQTYTYAVWAVDGAGNVSALSTTRSFVALRAPVLKTPALVSSVSKDTTFHVSWLPKFGNPAGTTYSVQWLKANGTWAAWQNGVTTTSATFGAAASPTKALAGKAYKLRAYVTDVYGNTSAKAGVAWIEPKDDRSASVKGGWAKSSSSTYWLGTARTTTHAKASLSISLTGSTLWIVGDRLTKGSQAAIYVDGKKVATIDTHGTTLHRHVLWTKHVKAGKHSVRIVNLATKGRTHLSIDGFAGA